MAHYFLVLALLAVAPVVSLGQISECQGVFPPKTPVAKFGDRCFGFAHEYTDGFFRAQKICQYFKGSLALVKDKETNAFLANFIKNTLKADVKTTFWIGLDDHVEEGKFVWADETPMVYNNFKGKQGTSPALHDCVAMDADGYWYDHECFVDFDHAQGMNFICEYKAQNKG